VEISKTKRKITLIEKKANLDLGSFEIKITIKIIIFINFRAKEKKIL
jgi:hypothetical protein